MDDLISNAAVPLLFYYGPDPTDYTKNRDVTSIVIHMASFTTENMNHLFGDNAPGHLKYLSIVSKDTNLLLQRISETDPVETIYPSRDGDGDGDEPLSAVPLLFYYGPDPTDYTKNTDVTSIITKLEFFNTLYLTELLGDSHNKYLSIVSKDTNALLKQISNADPIQTIFLDRLCSIEEKDEKKVGATTKEPVFEKGVLKTFGFIMSRHVRCPGTNEYWIEACRCIREFHPENLIIIIDDGSNKEFLTENNVYNCIVIESEFPGAGELLPYYYFYKTRLLDKACMIHDGTFIKKAIDPENVHDVQFLWNFTICLEDGITRDIIKNILSCDDDIRSSLLDRYNNYRFQGCFGVMSIVSYTFIHSLVKKYDIFRILRHVRGRIWRCAIERLFAVVCFHETSPTILFGDIHGQPCPFSLDLNGYQSSLKHNYNYPAYKIWTGR
jgi:hypothetical protein